MRPPASSSATSARSCLFESERGLRTCLVAARTASRGYECARVTGVRRPTVTCVTKAAKPRSPQVLRSPGPNPTDRPVFGPDTSPAGLGPGETLLSVRSSGEVVIFRPDTGVLWQKGAAHEGLRCMRGCRLRGRGSASGGGETAASIALVALVSQRAETWPRAGSQAARRVMSASIPTPRGQERTRAVP